MDINHVILSLITGYNTAWINWFHVRW